MICGHSTIFRKSVAAKVWITMGILLTFTGVLVHGHWKPYFTYTAVHVLCNAHHLRELQGVVDRDANQLALRLMKLLRLSWHYCKGFNTIGMLQMPSVLQERIEDIYDRILERALAKEAAYMERASSRAGTEEGKENQGL